MNDKVIDLEKFRRLSEKGTPLLPRQAIALIDEIERLRKLVTGRKWDDKSWESLCAERDAALARYDKMKAGIYEAIQCVGSHPMRAKLREIIGADDALDAAVTPGEGDREVPASLKKNKFTAGAGEDK